MRLLEALDHAVALLLPHATVQERDRRAEALGQIGRDEIAEFTELGEQQCLLTVRQHCLEHVLHQGELAGAVTAAVQHTGAVAEEMRGMVADLFEPGQRTEYGALARHPFRVLQFGQHVVDDRLVQRRLFDGQVRAHRHLQLLRQIADDGGIGLHPAQYERLCNGAQPADGVLVVIALDGDSEPGTECLCATEHLRHREIQNRAQFLETVLHWSPGERQPMPSGQCPRRLRLSGPRVLDVLCLVEHHPIPLLARQLGGVPGQERVSGDHQIRIRDGFVQFRTRCAAGTVVHRYPQIRGESLGLALPVADDRHGAHEQRRSSSVSALALMHKQGQHLHGFPQAHVVGQNSADAIPAHGGEPCQPTLLIWPQLRLQPDRCNHRYRLASPVQKVRGPTGCADLGDRHLLDMAGDEFADQIGKGDFRVVEMGGDIAGRGGQHLVVGLHPFPAQLHQIRFRADQPFHFGLGQHGIAEGEFPTVGDESAHANGAFGGGNRTLHA